MTIPPLNSKHVLFWALVAAAAYVLYRTFAKPAVKPTSDLFFSQATQAGSEVPGLDIVGDFYQTFRDQALLDAALPGPGVPAQVIAGAGDPAPVT